VREYPRTHLVYPFGTALHYTDQRTGTEANDTAGALQGWLQSRGSSDVSIEPTPATIEDVFIDRMGVPEEATRESAA
jgi:hypothetical protein